MDFSYLTVLPRGRQIWDNVVFPAEEFQARYDALSGLLENWGLDGLILYSDALSRRYINYLTNYCNSVSWSCSVCLFTLSDGPQVISSMAPRDVEYNMKSLPPSVSLHATGLGMLTNHVVAEKAMAYLWEHGLMGKRWGGVNLGALNVFGRDAIQEVLPNLSDCTAAFDALLAVKRPCEQFAIAQATSMAQKAVLDYLRMAVPGANEREIAARIDRQCRVYGVDNIALLVSAGRDAPLCLHQPRDAVIQEGDTVSAHVGILYLHYNGLFAASRFHGAADDARLGFLRSAKQDFAAARHALGGGTPLENINQTSSGYTLAAGIGADLSEPVQTGEVPLGGTVSLTLQRHSDDFGGVILADTFVRETWGLRSLGAPDTENVYA